ncbi:hypothetical protein ACFX19_030496 [Malus domestica]
MVSAPCVLVAASWAARTSLVMQLFIACVCNSVHLYYICLLHAYVTVYIKADVHCSKINKENIVEYQVLQSSLLQWAEDNSLIQCISIVPGAPTINHLFFADDSLMFCNAFLEEVNELRRIFLIYKNALGQRINFAKLAVCFSSSTGLQTKMQIHHSLGVPIVLCHERYLRLPTDKLWKKINGWEGKLLSKAGKEVLIKVPCQSMPSYTISGFKLPLSSCGWSWNSLETWKHLCKIKSVGGFRFWEISSFNQAMLGKQGWRLLEFPNSLIARMLKARYFKDSNFMEAQLGLYPSYTWRSLVWGRVLLHYGSRWRIGNGQAIRVYDDAWIPPSLT